MSGHTFTTMGGTDVVGCPLMDPMQPPIGVSLGQWGKVNPDACPCCGEDIAAERERAKRTTIGGEYIASPCSFTVPTESAREWAELGYVTTALEDGLTLVEKRGMREPPDQMFGDSGIDATIATIRQDIIDALYLCGQGDADEYRLSKALEGLDAVRTEVVEIVEGTPAWNEADAKATIADLHRDLNDQRCLVFAMVKQAKRVTLSERLLGRLDGRDQFTRTTNVLTGATELAHTRRAE